MSEKLPYIEQSKIAKPGISELLQNKVELESVKDMKNIDFLEKPNEEKWKYIVENNENLKLDKNGKLKEKQSFNFNFQGNEALYKMTTAGQIMPPEVRTITAGGDDWTRLNLLGEFFNKNNERLIIGDGEFKGNKSIIISGVGDIKTMEKSINQELINYLRDNPNDKEYEDIIKASMERGMDPKFSIKIIKPLIKDLDTIKRKAKIEYILTGIERIRGKFKLDNHEINHFMKDYLVENSFEVTTRKEIRDLIMDKDNGFGFEKGDPRIEEALQIIQAESGFDPNSKRSFYDNPGGGNDLGLFQINDYYHADKMPVNKNDIFKPKINIKIAAAIYKEAGNSWHPWVAARKMGLA